MTLLQTSELPSSAVDVDVDFVVAVAVVVGRRAAVDCVLSVCLLVGIDLLLDDGFASVVRSNGDPRGSII